MSEAERLAQLLDAEWTMVGGSRNMLLAAAELRRIAAELEECQAQRRAAFRRIEEQDKELEALKKAIGEPVGFMSEMQTPLVTDPEDDSGHYIPMRKTPKGNFQLALYALTKDQS